MEEDTRSTSSPPLSRERGYPLSPDISIFLEDECESSTRYSRCDSHVHDSDFSEFILANPSDLDHDSSICYRPQRLGDENHLRSLGNSHFDWQQGREEPAAAAAEHSRFLGHGDERTMSLTFSSSELPTRRIVAGGTGNPENKDWTTRCRPNTLRLAPKPSSLSTLDALFADY